MRGQEAEVRLRKGAVRRCPPAIEKNAGKHVLKVPSDARGDESRSQTYGGHHRTEERGVVVTVAGAERERDVRRLEELRADGIGDEGDSVVHPPEERAGAGALVPVERRGPHDLERGAADRRVENVTPCRSAKVLKSVSLGGEPRAEELHTREPPREEPRPAVPTPAGSGARH